MIAIVLLAIALLVGWLAYQNNWDWKLTLAALAALGSAALDWFTGAIGGLLG